MTCDGSECGASTPVILFQNEPATVACCVDGALDADGQVVVGWTSLDGCSSRRAPSRVAPTGLPFSSRIEGFTSKSPRPATARRCRGSGPSASTCCGSHNVSAGQVPFLTLFRERTQLRSFRLLAPPFPGYGIIRRCCARLRRHRVFTCATSPLGGSSGRGRDPAVARRSWIVLGVSAEVMLLGQFRVRRATQERREFGREGAERRQVERLAAVS